MRFGHEYLEKFIQLPIRLPIPSSADLTKFISDLSSPQAEAIDHKSNNDTNSADRRHQQPETIKGDSPSAKASAESLEQDLEDDKFEERDWDAFRLVEGENREELETIVSMVAPAVKNNPRRIIQFVNLFRFRLFTAFRTGIMNPKSGHYAVTPEQLAKFVALTIAWPKLRAEIETTPSLLIRLGIQAEKSEVDRDDPSPWINVQKLMELLGFLSREIPETFSIRTVNVSDLLRAAPPINPNRPTTISPGSFTPYSNEFMKSISDEVGPSLVRLFATDPAQMTIKKDDTLSIDLTTIFAGGDTNYTYSVSSLDDKVATATTAADVLDVSGNGIGSTTILITATDSLADNATASLAVDCIGDGLSGERSAESAIESIISTSEEINPRSLQALVERTFPSLPYSRNRPQEDLVITHIRQNGYIKLSQIYNMIRDTEPSRLKLTKLNQRKSGLDEIVRGMALQNVNYIPEAFPGKPAEFIAMVKQLAEKGSGNSA